MICIQPSSSNAESTASWFPAGPEIASRSGCRGRACASTGPSAAWRRQRRELPWICGEAAAVPEPATPRPAPDRPAPVRMKQVLRVKARLNSGWNRRAGIGRAGDLTGVRGVTPFHQPSHALLPIPKASKSPIATAKSQGSDFTSRAESHAAASSATAAEHCLSGSASAGLVAGRLLRSLAMWHFGLPSVFEGIGVTPNVAGVYKIVKQAVAKGGYRSQGGHRSPAPTVRGAVQVPHTSSPAPDTACRPGKVSDARGMFPCRRAWRP